MAAIGRRSLAITQKLSPTHQRSGLADVESVPVSQETHQILRSTGVSIHQRSQLLGPFPVALNDAGQIGNHHQRVVKPAVVHLIEEPPWGVRIRRGLFGTGILVMNSLSHRRS